MALETQSTGAAVLVAARGAAGAAGHGDLVAALEDFGRRSKKGLDALGRGAEQAGQSLRGAAVCYAATDAASARSFTAE